MVAYWGAQQGVRDFKLTKYAMPSAAGGLNATQTAQQYEDGHMKLMFTRCALHDRACRPAPPAAARRRPPPARLGCGRAPGRQPQAAPSTDAAPSLALAAGRWWWGAARSRCSRRRTASPTSSSPRHAHPPALGPACSLLRAAPARARRAASSVQASNHAHLAAVTTVLREYLYSEQYSGFQTVIFL